MERQRGEHSQEIKDLKAAHEREIAELRASMGTASAAEVERLKALHAE